MANNNQAPVFELPAEPVVIPPSIPAAAISKSGVNMNGMAC